MTKEYLSEEEQYKEILNLDEISRIKDFKLRQIREKYFLLYKKAFLNENEIPDYELESVVEEIHKKEQAEIEEYKRELK